MDLGEAERLYWRTNARRCLLIDELNGRRIAKREGIPIIG